MEGIAKALPEIIKTVVKLVRTFISNLKDYLPRIIEAGIDIILALIDGLTDPETIEAFIETIGDIISIMIDTLGKVDWLKTADKIFSVCMGEEVEPRRRFIEENSSYANLDI